MEFARREYLQKRIAKKDNSLIRIPDSFRKIAVVGNKIIPWRDENGILYFGIEQFLLDEKAIVM